MFTLHLVGIFLPSGFWHWFLLPLYLKLLWELKLKCNTY